MGSEWNRKKEQRITKIAGKIEKEKQFKQYGRKEQNECFPDDGEMNWMTFTHPFPPG